MATIKSYTDLEQSRTLAKILSIQSADMYWDLLSKDKYAKVNNIGHCLCRTCVYAWSLAALLEEIPEVINFDDDESDYTLEILKEHELYYLSYGNPLRYGKIEIEPQENFVDACVAMIEKLNELNLL